MPLKILSTLVAFVLAFVLPFQAVQAASGSSTNAGKLARSASASTRRAGGRVVRRKKARVTSRSGSTKRVRRTYRSKKTQSKKALAKKTTRKTVRKSRKVSSSKRRVSKSRRKARATKRRVRTSKKMVKIARGPVEPVLVKAAYSAIETGKLKTKARFECIPDELKAVLGQIAAKWGTVTVNSSHRSVAHNRKVGGKRRSFHLKCQAADFNVAGSHRGLVAFLKKHPLVGGYKRYRAGHFHIDVGPKRTW